MEFNNDTAALGIKRKLDECREQLAECRKARAEAIRDFTLEYAKFEPLLEAIKPLAVMKPIPATLPPESILFRFGTWQVYLRDLLKLRTAFAEYENPADDSVS